MTRKQWVILVILATLDLLVVGGIGVVWVQMSSRLSQPAPTAQPTPVTEANILENIRAFIEDPALTLTPGEVRSTAFGQQTRLYRGTLTASGEDARFEVNAETGTVTGFLRLGAPPRQVNVDLETAQATATAFAEAHHPGFDARERQQTHAQPMENDAQPKIYVFRWIKQDARSGALLPDAVTVQINAETGYVDAYESLRVPVTVATQPHVTEAQARDIALKAAAHLSKAEVMQTTLAVSTLPMHAPDGEQALLWRVLLEGLSEGLPTQSAVFINAHTGEIVAVE